MECPVCKGVNLTMSDRQGIEVDYCPQCRGAWQDRGELDKIIERSSADARPTLPAAPSTVSPRQPGNSTHAQDSPDSDHCRRKKKKHLPGELLGFLIASMVDCVGG